jgi:hypothetical protein
MPEDDMLKAAEAEVQRLEAEIAKTSLGKKLELARMVVALYGQGEAPERRVQGVLAQIDPSQQGGRSSSQYGRGTTFLNGGNVLFPAAKTKTAQIELVCADYLRQHHKRASSGELAKIVLAAGIRLPGAMPSRTLASFLSNSKLFDNDRAEGGYGLKEWREKRLEPEIETATQ